MNLPEDMVMEILVKTPVRSLVRLSCVCKTWRALIIKNHYFGHEKLLNNMSTHPTMIFLKGNQEEILLTNNPLPIVSRNKTIDDFFPVGSCNGIFCFAGIDFQLLLYNPITQEYRELPPPPFHSENTLSLWGFGFDASNKDYKIIMMIGNCVEIYRLRPNKWAKLELDLESGDYMSASYGVFASGFCHWAVKKTILTFDFGDEKFGKMSYPNQVELRVGIRCIHVLDDSLAFISCSESRKHDVWVMMEYGKTESWTKKFSVALPFHSKILNIVSCWSQINTGNIVILGPSRWDNQSVAYIASDQEDKGRVFFKRNCCYFGGVVFRPTLASFSLQPADGI